MGIQPIAIDCARNLKLMVFDVDGVMTDGTITLLDDGQELKNFNAQDGLGIQLLLQSNIEVAIITGRQCACVQHRMEKLGIQHIYQGIKDKPLCLKTLQEKLSIAPEETGFMGDDLPDLAAMAASGFSATPANGHRMNKMLALLTTELSGGHGAVRETCEFILAAQGKLDSIIAQFLPSYPHRHP